MSKKYLKNAIQERKTYNEILIKWEEIHFKC